MMKRIGFTLNTSIWCTKDAFSNLAGFLTTMTDLNIRKQWYRKLMHLYSLTHHLIFKYREKTKYGKVD